MARLLPLLLAAALGCGDDGAPTPDAATSPAPDAPTSPAPDAATTAPDAGGGCARTPAPADRTRRVIVSHPYDAAGDPAPTYELLELSPAGALSRSGTTFALGRATQGEIVFTPDGEVALVPQEDGTVGVVRFEQGAPVVVHAAFAGAFYAARVVMDPGGARAFVVDTNWVDNGGGIYAVAIGCDGTLTEEGRVVEAKLPAALVTVPDGSGRVVVPAAEMLGSPVGHDVHLLAWGAVPARLAGADAFGDDEAIVSAAAVTPDAKYALIGDYSGFSGVPNRVAVVAIGPGDALVPRQVLSPLEDPFALIASPFGDAALVVSGFGDALFRLTYDPANAAAPFAVAGELDYTGAPPQLPGSAVLVDRGALRGRVLVAENVAVRQLDFQDGGAIVDLGPTSLGAGYEAIAGAIGVEP